ncbi:transient receptor potential channel pyrexia-like [Pseudomyrmex gracilis]|uniref:transient receptor potential channel pyrexia-like n=1 Tax=Pseudomyrmex gracilis TaxID=219809 RepID=UPI000995117E|nr:transient receptor potential channel pyrexia-like [Pseudomyrmex gracilis]
MVDNFGFVFSTSSTRDVEKAEEEVSKPAPELLPQTSTTSLFLNRLKCKYSSKQDGSQLENRTQRDSPLIPFSSTDYSVISERYSSEETVHSTCLRINEDFIRNVLTEHRKRLNRKSQIWENLELNDTDEIKAELENSTPDEINVLLLQASFIGNTDLICTLCELGANVNYIESNQSLTPLHLCAFRNCLDGVKFLMDNGATIDSYSKHTPFHYAAFGDAVDVARYFIQQGVSQENPNDDEETVLHVATRTNAVRVLSLLLPISKELLDRLDQDGYAAIHHAADGNPICMEMLLKAGCQVDLLTKNKDSALHLAAQAGCADTLALLVEAKANLQLKNHRGHTALHLAARAHSLECVEILLKGRADPNAEDDECRTPLHLALGKSVMTDEIIELLLKWRANVNKADKYGYTPLHIAASNELSRCVNLLIRYEADLTARTIGGNSALSIVLRKTPTSLDMFENRLDASLTLKRQGFVAGELELQLDFHPLMQNRRNRQGRCPEIGYLNTFVKEGYNEILEHPLCQSFIYLKWHKIRKYYGARVCFYLVYVLILTSWVITALAHNCYNEARGFFMKPPLCANATGIYGFFFKHPNLLNAQWYIVIVLTVLEAFRKLAVIPTYRSFRQFFTQMENLVEWFVILSVFSISFVYEGRTHNWQNHMGALAVLCGWSNSMLMIGQLPAFGAYVAMFTSVQAQVFKLLLAYACLLVGFTASFCVIFPSSKSFSSPHTGLIKVLAMMTGELGFEDLFFQSDKGGAYDKGGIYENAVIYKNATVYENATVHENATVYDNIADTSRILLHISAQLSFVLFLLFVTIVLMNLLIGIAVHDIKGLQKTAGLAKLVRQTKLIHDVEIAIFLGLSPSKRFGKCLRWTSLFLPSPLRAVLTVRPLNPREKRLPRDILSTAYKIAKEGTGQSTFAALRKKTYGPTSYLNRTKTSSKIDSNACRRREPEDDALLHDCNRFKNEIAELRQICEKNYSLLQELVREKNKMIND